MSPDPTTEPIVKLMSLAEHEFIIGCERLAGEGDLVTKGEAHINIGQGFVVIRYDALPDVRLGGSLELPRANVSLTFTSVPREEQEIFKRRFEMTFHRGGG